MRHEYIRFNNNNIAPKGAKSIGVYEVVDGNTRNFVGNIPIDKISHPDINGDDYLYSFGIVSDTHLSGDSYTNYTDLENRDPATAGTKLSSSGMYAGTKLRKTLEYMKNNYVKDINFCCSAGDATSTGLYIKDTTNLTNQFLEYKDIIDQVGIEMYTACGNHESYNGDIDEAKLQEYTGHGLMFSITKGNDVFIFIGQPSQGIAMRSAHLKQAQTILEANKTKRCFVFIHSYFEGDSGDPGDYRTNSIFYHYELKYTFPIGVVFKQIMSHYKNAIVFHGHSHMKFDHQEKYQNIATYNKSIYTDANGFKSVHVPSLYSPRDIDEDADYMTPEDIKGGQGYIVDVYKDYIVLNGYDFINLDGNNNPVFNPKPNPLGTFKIDTTFDPIGTFDTNILIPLNHLK